MGNPMVFAEAKAGEKSFPPVLGEDTVDVLRNVLGISEATIGEFLSSGAVVASKGNKDQSKAS
jgi:crotonobetainyl-CoA:carnitine CoA-transferase CaiB-like acyl-CoA transferase